MGNAVDTTDVQPVIKHFEVEHRAVERRRVGDAACIAQNLFGVVTLMTAQGFHLACQAGRQFREGGRGRDVHRHRQYVQHRPGSAQGRRPHAAHKNDPHGKIVAPAQAACP